MAVWDAEREIDAAYVCAQVGAASARLVGEGWDNTVWMVSTPEQGPLLARFPRRAVAVPGIRTEARVLVQLAEILPLPVPVPCRANVEPDEPWPWLAYTPIAGRELAEWLDGRTAASETTARRLGGFLRVLHAPETLYAVDPDASIGIDLNARGAAAELADRASVVVNDLPTLGVTSSEMDAIHRHIDAIRAFGERTWPLVLCHGDLYERHVLVDADGAVTGIIDWGDMCRAPAWVDLMLYWSAFDAASRTVFADAYGSEHLDSAALTCARALALHECGHVALYARDMGFDWLERSSLASLRRALDAFNL